MPFDSVWPGHLLTDESGLLSTNFNYVTIIRGKYGSGFWFRATKTREPYCFLYTQDMIIYYS